jgi:hypothetical protein
MRPNLSCVFGGIGMFSSAAYGTQTWACVLSGTGTFSQLKATGSAEGRIGDVTLSNFTATLSPLTLLTRLWA